MPHLLVIGGSDAGISASMRARELDPGTDVTMVVADAYPNFSICGIPFYLSGETPDWHDLAHRTREEIEASGLSLRLDTRAVRIDAAEKSVVLRAAGGAEEVCAYDRLVIGTGAMPIDRRSWGSAKRACACSNDGRHVRTRTASGARSIGRDRRRRLHRPGDGRRLRPAGARGRPHRASACGHDDGR